MAPFAKGLIVIGAVVMMTGLVLYFAGKVPWLGRLPGDIIIKKDNFTFYFPFATCLVLSLIVSLLLY